MNWGDVYGWEIRGNDVVFKNEEGEELGEMKIGLIVSDWVVERKENE